MRVDLYEPADIESPERCHCGHYSYRHGPLRCGLPAHPDHTAWGRVAFDIFGRTVGIIFRCPCRLGRVDERAGVWKPARP